MKKLEPHQMVELSFEKRKKSMSICYHLMKKTVFQKIFECPTKRFDIICSREKMSENFRRQWRRQQKKISEDQRRVQSREKHVIRQEVTDRRKLEEMSRKLVSMTLIVIYRLGKICSTKGKAQQFCINYNFDHVKKSLSRDSFFQPRMHPYAGSEFWPRKVFERLQYHALDLFPK